MTTINAAQLLKKLQETQGPLSVNEGVLWFDNGESVDLSKVGVESEPEVVKRPCVVRVGYGELGSGENHFLGTWRGMASSEADAENQALDELWDRRLDVASCGPRIKVRWLEEAQAPKKPAGWTRDVFVKAFCTGDFGEGPSFAKMTVDEAFLDQLESLRGLCEEEGLSEVRVTSGPTMWGGCDENALRLQCPEMVVSCNSFWFNDQPKHVDYEIQTRAQTIGQFVQNVLAGDDTLFIDGVEEDIAALDADGILDDDDDDGHEPLTNTCAEIPISQQSAG